jgi:hypothetical protein
MDGSYPDSLGSIVYSTCKYSVLETCLNNQSFIPFYYMSTAFIRW